MLNRLHDIREAVDYEDAIPNDAAAAHLFGAAVERFLRKVRSNTPLLLYSEFIETYIGEHPEIEALEFDYYCPKSYLHKERIQLQVKAEGLQTAHNRRIKRAGALAIQALLAARGYDYVLGWNNRFGQGGDGYLLFLDLDALDEGRVKAALKGRAGWLFKSGLGFHFVSKEVSRSRDSWISRLEQAAGSKLLGELIDQQYAKFSIRRGYSTLRITTGENKAFIPFLCWDNT